MNNVGEKIGAGLIALAGVLLWINDFQNGWTMAMIILGVVCAL